MAKLRKLNLEDYGKHGETIDVKSQVRLLNQGEEDEGKPRSAEIILMESGWNDNGIYFSNEKLKELPDKIMSRKKLYMNHDLWFSSSRSVSEWLGTFTNVEYVENNGVGQLKGTFDFTNNPETIWIYDEIERDPEEVQFSTHLLGYTEDGEMEGRKGKIVTSWASYGSTDCVSYGAARGRALRVKNSLGQDIDLDDPEFIEYIKQYNPKTNNIKGENVMENTIKSAADLAAQHPTLVKEIVSEAKEEFRKENDLQKKEDELKSLRNFRTENEAKVKQLNTDLSNLKSEKEKLDKEIADLKKEKDALKLKVDNYEAGEKAAKLKNDIQNAIKEAGLDEKFVSETFMNSLMKMEKMEDVKASIEDRKKIVGGEPVIQSGATKKEEGEDTKSEEKYKNDDVLVADLKS